MRKSILSMLLFIVIASFVFSFSAHDATAQTDGIESCDEITLLHTGNDSVEFDIWNIDSFEVPSDCMEIVQERYQQLTEMLQTGGYVLYVRHAITDRSTTDTNLDSCDTQRLLSDEGREQAQSIQPAFEALEIPVAQIISTQYCRTMETAELAFGEPEIISRDDLTQQLFDIFTTVLEPTNDEADEPRLENIIIVSHIGMIIDVTGLDDLVLEEGDTLVIQPLGDGEYNIIARITASGWGILAESVEEPES